jgi:hypothetical protein
MRERERERESLSILCCVFLPETLGEMRKGGQEKRETEVQRKRDTKIQRDKKPER